MRGLNRPVKQQQSRQEDLAPHGTVGRAARSEFCGAARFGTLGGAFSGGAPRRCGTPGRVARERGAQRDRLLERAVIARGGVDAAHPALAQHAFHPPRPHALPDEVVPDVVQDGSAGFGIQKACRSCLLI